MIDRPIEPRPISTQEAAIVRAAIERTSVEPLRSALLGTVSGLVVVSRCKCGCTSIDFEFSGELRPDHKVVADGLGRIADGRQVGVLVWGDERGIKGLEIHDMDEGDPSKSLPMAESIEPWGPDRRTPIAAPRRGS